MVGAGFIILVLARGVAIMLLCMSMLVRFFAMLLCLAVNAIVDRPPQRRGTVDVNRHGRETMSLAGTLHALQVRGSLLRIARPGLTSTLR